MKKKNNEFILRDEDGKELAVFDLLDKKMKIVNLYENGLIGKVVVDWEEVK